MAATRSYITEIVLNDEMSKRCSSKRIITFKDGVNIITGPSGSGKSTLLSILGQTETLREVRAQGVQIRMTGACRTIYYDTESMNPRMRPGVPRMCASHGQVMQPILSTRLRSAFAVSKEKHDSIVGVIDEPEAGLDYDGVCEFIRAVYDVVEDGAQIIIATHSPLIWQYPNANFIDLLFDYRERVLSSYIALMKKVDAA